MPTTKNQPRNIDMETPAILQSEMRAAIEELKNT